MCSANGFADLFAVSQSSSTLPTFWLKRAEEDTLENKVRGSCPIKVKFVEGTPMSKSNTKENE